MSQIDNVKVIYCSQYNGVYFFSNNDDLLTDFDDETTEKAERLEHLIVTFAYDFCDDNGKFVGIIRGVERFARAKVKEIFGDVDFTFEEDDTSD